MKSLKIAVAGASGRMGRMLIEAIIADDQATLAGALDLPGSPVLGTDAAVFLGQCGGPGQTRFRVQDRDARLRH